MARRPRARYTDSQKALIWERWRRGESLRQIAELFDRHQTSVHRVLAETGGIRPAVRRRAERALTLIEREEISRSAVSGVSIRSVALRLHRAPSTISREIKRCGGREAYRASQADQLAWERALRPKICKLVRNKPLARRVAAKLRLQWSPEQIAGWLKCAFPGHEDDQVSHETIYRTLFIQARGALKKELLAHLRSTRALRRLRPPARKNEGTGRIRNTVSISERPASVEDRAIPGHWEGDLLMGGRYTQIATLVERQTRYVALLKVAGKDTQSVVDALIKHAQKMPQELYKTLTWDRGKELADHQRFTVATDIQVYFCDPRHPWQRGSNENTNGLLRQYLPKATDLSAYSQAQLNAIARRLNERPRKTLNFDTPAKRFQLAVASTG